jgi:TolB-like protein/class 3 adenylate cyclase/Tfp pilus assembly protein PilF
MPNEQQSKLRLEIAHVLFIDIVGYSKLLLNQQSSSLRELNEIVCGTAHFREAEAEGKLIRLPTGDGMALVFRTNPDAPAHCALEISEALKGHPNIRLRMGVHSGPVQAVTDVNQSSNIAGAGINMAQRVMDCGDAGHILLSKHVAEDLEQDEYWQPHLHDLGECEVKHGVRISLVNLCSDRIGNPKTPEKLRQAKREAAIIARRRRTRTLLVTSILVAALFGAGYWVFRRQLEQKRATQSLAIPLKSIAVLPFENLSASAENAFFADGVQDEILTNLARIADLKVISRTSVMQYKAGMARNARAIAQSLGVAHLLEGSVQRAAGKVRINAQLIDARNDTHLWAETYDRDLADVFAIQTEIAKAIADQLRVQLSPEEKSELERRPTSNDEAFALYTQARTLLISASSADAEKATYEHAADLLDRAVARDPDFFLAYCDLVHAHAELYFYNFDRTPARQALAESALQNAERLRPDAGETHLAKAEYLYRCHLKFDRARAELALAARQLPNSSRVYALSGFIDRRQGHWDEAVRNLEKARQLDPQNIIILQQIANCYPYLRRFKEETEVVDRILALTPRDPGTRVSRAFIELERYGNLEPYREVVRSLLAESPEDVADIALEWFKVSWYGHDAAEATKAAAAIPASGGGSNAVRFPRAWYEGLAAWLRGDSASAHDAFMRARVEVQHSVEERPEYGPLLSVLGMIDAMLNRKDDAIGQGRRAVELLPIEQDSINGSLLLMNLAVIYAQTGEKDLAIQQLHTVLGKPGEGNYGEFRVDPFWDPLRGDPHFEQIVASLAPKE